MNKVLNDAQRKLVEENHSLIYKYLNSRNLSMDSIEDWYGTAAIGLCQAALCYDPNKGIKFSTLAYVCMDNSVRTIMRDGRKNVAIFASLDDSIPGTTDCVLADIIPDPHDLHRSVCLSDAIECALEKLTDRDKQFVYLITNKGMTQANIARQFGVSRTLVSNAYCKFINSIRNYLSD